MSARPLCLVLLLVLVLGGCDTNEQPPIYPATILGVKVTPNPVAPRTPLRVEITLDDSTRVYDYEVQSVGDGPDYITGSRYSRFTTLAPADTGQYRMAVRVHGSGALSAATSSFTLTVRP